LKHSTYYMLVFGQARSGHLSRAGRKAVAELQRMITRVAAVGRLRMSVEQAAAVMHAAGVGVVSTMISAPPEARGLKTADVTRDVVFDAITTLPAAEPASATTGAGAAGPAMALRAALGQEKALPLSPGEKLLLLEWLNRLADERTSAG
jgi:hypothetical protein